MQYLSKPQGKFLTEGKQIDMAFVDLEKASDQVP